jgi:hypothetical protein
MIDRRSLLSGALTLSAGLALSRTIPICADPESMVTVRPTRAQPIPIPEDFIGLGYEMSSVAALGLLSPSNQRYVKLVEGLGTQGVLRVGGIVANYTRYEPNGVIKADKHETVITRASLDQFAEFLRTVGWTTIWSVNFAQGSIEEAVKEAKAVADVLGDSLLALEIGNEVENYDRGPKAFRSAPYSYETYRAEYARWHAAIAAAVPGLRFAAPDTASNLEWPERLAADAHGDVQLLTTHYYRTNQIRGSADQLAGPDPHLGEILERMGIASRQSRIPWRLCEANSFSGGGRPGVSDTLLGALWTLDLLLLLAANRVAGVNIETGVNQLGFVSSYSPIQDDGNGVNTAGVPYYGMLAFSVARRGCRDMIPVELSSSSPGLTAYALGSFGKVQSVVVINRDSQIDAHITLGDLGIGSAKAIRLTAPSIESKSDVTLGGATVNPGGEWHSTASEHIDHGLLSLPHGSAVIVRTR